MSERKIGYTTLTYKLRLYDRHHNWLVITKQLYNQVVWHYCKVLEENKELLEQTNFFLLRKLEEMTVGTKEKRAKQERPIRELSDFPKIPLYFRRAAINTAIRISRIKKQQEKLFDMEEENYSPIFYKGMYRQFQERSIELKLYNGKKWVWVLFPFTGREIPKEGKTLSPTLQLKKKDAYLHVPVMLPVSDIRTVNERMETERFICAVFFPNGDTLAVCVKMQIDGSVKDNYFIYGGRRREEQRKAIWSKIEKSRKSRGRKEDCKNRAFYKMQTEENKKLYQKLKRINRYYAEDVSSKVLGFCVQHRIKIIVVPNYESSFGFYSFYWRGRAVIRCLKRKAFRYGIVVTGIYPYHIFEYGSECGRKIQNDRKNVELNAAQNIGKQFLQRFGQKNKIR